MNKEEIIMQSYPIDRESIKLKTKNILEQHGFVSLSQFPFPVEKVAKRLEYEIVCFVPQKESKNISGAISKKQKKILINDNDSYLRQRFTLAHEIGHACLHFSSGTSEEEFVDFRIPGVVTVKELEADEFAACLLMPEGFFKEAWELTNKNFDKLSNIFFVSKAAIGFRAFNLNLNGT